MLMNLEQKYLDKAVQDLANDIDFDVMADLLGWTRVTLDRFILRFQSLDMDIWIKQHCSGQHKSFGNKFIFENPKDATMFILRWGHE